MLGEEFGVSGSGGRRWIVDPIDGTRNYSRGIPVWATLIALEEDGAIRSASSRRRRSGGAGGPSAVRGHSPTASGSTSRASPTSRTPSSRFALEQKLPALAHRCWHPRAYGDFWAHMLVAEGAVDGAIDAVGVKLWDLAAIQPIVEEAGGRFTDQDGAARSTGAAACRRTGSSTRRCSRRGGRS